MMGRSRARVQSGTMEAKVEAEADGGPEAHADCEADADAGDEADANAVSKSE